MTNREAEELLEIASARLSEHFEAVQILVSWPEDGGGGTKCLKRGSGNFYSRQGMASEFISEDSAHDMAYQIANVLEREEED